VSSRLASIAASVLGRVLGSRAVAGRPGLRTESELDVFLHRYYLEPHPELVASAIEYIGRRRILENEGAAAAVVAFFAEVFSRNATRVAEWTAILDRQPRKVRAALGRSVSFASDPSALLDEEPVSPQRNDMCWGAFFASGDQRYLLQLIRQLALMDERDDLGRFLVGASAKWSLASNAESHPVVKEAIEAARATASDTVLRQLDEILAKTPQEIRQEVNALVGERRRKRES